MLRTAYSWMTTEDLIHVAVEKKTTDLEVELAQRLHVALQQEEEDVDDT